VFATVIAGLLVLTSAAGATEIQTGPGSTLSFTGSGQCVVSADQPGTANYLSASTSITISIEPPAPPLCSSVGVDVPSGDLAKISLGCIDAPGDQGDPLSLAVTSLPEAWHADVD